MRVSVVDEPPHRNWIGHDRAKIRLARDDRRRCRISHHGLRFWYRDLPKTSTMKAKRAIRDVVAWWASAGGGVGAAGGGGRGRVRRWTRGGGAADSVEAVNLARPP